ncbi:MAG: outer membrane lipoprotein-sorting protein [Spirochaetia bacterium]
MKKIRPRGFSSKGITPSIPLFIAFLMCISAGSLFAIDGKQVAQNVYDRDSGDTVHALVEMDLVSSDGSVKERILEGWGGEGEEDRSNMVLVFHRPSSVQGTRFLVKERDSGDDDQWIYLPSLDRVRRIASSEEDSSFMGTDFTYGDMQSRSVDEDTHELLREETFADRDCYVVESVPKDPDDSQYSKRIQWVAKDIWVPLKTEFYDTRGDHLKTMTVKELEKVQGYWTTMETRMENVQSGHATEIRVDKIKYDEELQDSLFTTRFLETGRAR